MGAHHFVKVFDIADSGFRDWKFSAFGLIFVAIGTVIFFGPNITKRLGIPYLASGSKRFTFFRYFYLGFALLWTGTSFFSTYAEYQRHRELAETNACSVVEGQVEDFVPMPYTGHANESFTVSGVTFSYSDYAITDGFNNTSSHGGPINANSYVRICYDPSSHAILRLEIRDFRGAPKDYSRDELFPDFKNTPIRTQNPDRNPFAPSTGFIWLGNLWVALYFLNLLAVWGMYIPYLKTFWRLKNLGLPAIPIPDWLASGTKVNLRNNRVYWDRSEHVIWLRPRGLNFVPLAVTKLKTDDDDRTIVAQEVRFSSGFVLVFILFIFTAYEMFSSVLSRASNGPPMDLIVGIMIVFFCFGGYMTVRRTSARMQHLTEDALAELGERQP
jgi:hypothetical protein